MKMRELLWLLPALALYVVVIAAFATDEKIGDEGRYLNLAGNLTHGYYTTRDNVDLWCGPGYPLVLMPWVALGAPVLAMKLLNGVFLFVGVCLMYATARQYAGRAASLIFAWLLAVYPLFLRFLPFVLTETLAVTLVCCIVFFLTRWYRTRRVVWPIACALAFAFLALTKVFFGWVLMIGLVVCFLLSLAKPLRPLWRTGLVLALAFVLCVPYLVYTYRLTGRALVWGTSGGMCLYFLSTPYPGEYGNWRSTAEVMSDPNLEHHKPLFEEMEGLDQIERDSRFKQEALKNIRRAPAKFVKNWALNVTRMVFSYPFSYTLQKPSTFFYLVPNMFLVVLAVSLIYPTIAGRRRVPAEILAVLLVAFLALGGSSLLSAEARFFAVGVPMLAIWMLVVLVRVVRVRLERGLAEGTGQVEGTLLEPGVKGNSEPTDSSEKEQRNAGPADDR
jgi:hypothetical protein